VAVWTPTRWRSELVGEDGREPVGCRLGPGDLTQRQNGHLDETFLDGGEALALFGEFPLAAFPHGHVADGKRETGHDGVHRPLVDLAPTPRGRR